MRLHLVKRGYDLKNYPLVKNTIPYANEEYEERIKEEVVRWIQSALDNKESRLAIDMDSFVGGDCNYSYITDVIIDEVGELVERLDIPQNFHLYLRGATKAEGKYFDVYKKAMEELGVEKQSFGDPGDPLKEMFEDFQKKLGRDKEFRYLLTEMIEAKGFKKDSDAYKAAGVSKSVFCKKTNKKLKMPSLPSRGTVAAFAIGLRLNLDETRRLYESAGYHLGRSHYIDRTIMFFIAYGIYDIDEVNFCLYHYKLPLLGEQPREDKVGVSLG